MTDHAAMADLELRFRGPIPMHLRRAAMLGGPEAAALAGARATLRCYRDLIADTHASVLRCRARAEDTECPTQRALWQSHERRQLKSLRWYMRRKVRTVRRIAALQRIIALKTSNRRGPK